jgi:hypothetical protein
MQYRLTALALMLAGFLAINYFMNEWGQEMISQRRHLQDPAGQMEQGTVDAGPDYLRGIRAFEDTLNAINVSTGVAVAFRDLSRTWLAENERLLTADFLRQALWRQTLFNLLWGLFSAVFLLPFAIALDRRREQAAPAVAQPEESEPAVARPEESAPAAARPEAGSPASEDPYGPTASPV